MKKTLALIALAAFAATPAQAADLGGNCCADLEERIAELEATTARKGNRKVSLTVYGQVNANLLIIDADGFSDERIAAGAGDLNSSFVGFAGKAQINQDLSAGFVLELDAQQYGVAGFGETEDIGTRQSYLFLKSASLGGIALGKTSNATNNFDAITTANTVIVSQPLSLQPVSNNYLGGLDLPFDGSYRDVIRYDTPVWAGFVASASYGASGLDDTGDTGNMWDVALRYAGEFGGFKATAGVGYRVDDGQEFELNVSGVQLVIPTLTETQTFLAAASVMHIETGLFLTANYADQDWDGPADLGLEMWQLQGGIERKWSDLGKTTLFGEYGIFEVDDVSGDSDLWGIGLVQSIDAAAMDLYIGYKAYSVYEEDVDTFTAGGRIKF